MKKIIFAVLMLLACVNTNAQSVVKEGNTFKAIHHASRTSRDTLATKFEYMDSKGNKYPIVVNKKSGACYIWKKSNRTGKLYKQYLPMDIAQSVCKEVGLTYVPKQKKEQK